MVVNTSKLTIPTGIVENTSELALLKQEDIEAREKGIKGLLQGVADADSDSIVIIYQKNGELVINSEYVGSGLEFLEALHTVISEILDAN